MGNVWMKTQIILFFIIGVSVGCASGGKNITHPQVREQIQLQNLNDRVPAASPVVEVEIPPSFGGPGYPSPDAFHVAIRSVQQFLHYMDLASVHLGAEEGGAPGLFVAVPSVMTMKFPADFKPWEFLPDTPRPPLIPGISDVIGYYFKGGTGNTIDNKYSDDAPARDGETGSEYGYPCLKDDASNKALLDFNLINSEALSSAAPKNLTPEDLAILGKKTTPSAEMISNAEKAKGKLWTLANGFRIVDLFRTGVYTDCKFKIKEGSPEYQEIMTKAYAVPPNEKRDVIAKLGWDYVVHPAHGKIAVQPELYASSNVMATATWNREAGRQLIQADDGFGNQISYVVDAKGNALKADSINVVNFGEFWWMRHKDGKVKHVDWLIQLYKDMGYTYRTRPWKPR